MSARAIGGIQFDEVLDEVEKSKRRGAVILGALLESTRRFQSPRFPAEIVDRATSIWDLIDATGKKIVVDASTVRATLKRAGVRDLNVLAAMSHWRQDPAFTQNASTTLGRTAQELLDRQFGTHLTLTEEAAAIRSTGGAWLIELLVQALTHDGIEVAVFQGYFETLVEPCIFPPSDPGIVALCRLLVTNRPTSSRPVSGPLSCCGQRVPQF